MDNINELRQEHQDYLSEQEWRSRYLGQFPPEVGDRIHIQRLHSQLVVVTARTYETPVSINTLRYLEGVLYPCQSPTTIIFDLYACNGDTSNRWMRAMLVDNFISAKSLEVISELELPEGIPCDPEEIHDVSF